MLYLRSLYRFLFISLIMLISNQGNAAIVGFIDNGNYTTDSFSGLDWLDITESTNRSYIDVSAQFGISGDYEGWRYATVAEVVNFFDNAGGTAPYSGDTDGQQSWVTDLLGLWGVTYTNTGNNGAFQITGDPWVSSATARSMIRLADNYPPGSSNPNDFALATPTLSFSDNQAGDAYGSALVRLSAVPVPAAVWLFGTALLGLIGFSKKRRAA
jgi:hypothetical protein